MHRIFTRSTQKAQPARWALTRRRPRNASGRQVTLCGSQAANPEMLIRYGAENVYDEETGMKLPEKIVVYGSFQSHVGAVKNDSNSELTRMYYIGDNTYTLSVVIPFAGTYDYSISTYGTLSATYQADGYPRSGSSNKAHFTTWKDNTVVRFRYQFITNKVTVEMFE